MKIESVRIEGTTGANMKPHSGEAIFSDGKRYDWMFLPEGDVRFFFYRSTHDGTAHSLVSFASRARAKALKEHLGIS